MFDPVAVKALALYPKPNQAGNAFTNQNKLGIQNVPRSPTDKFDLKLDHFLSQNRRMFVRYNRFKQDTAAADFWDNGATPSDGIMYWGSHNIAADYTETMGASTVLTLRFGLSRFNACAARLLLRIRCHCFGLAAGSPRCNITNRCSSIPRFDVQDYTSIGPNNGSTYGSDNTAYTAR